MNAKKPTKKKVTPAGSPMDVNLLQQIVSLMASNELNMVDVRDGDRRIVLKRGVDVVSAPVATSVPVVAAAPTAVTAKPAVVDENEGLNPIKSPMVGTFYTAASPEARAFVSVGDKVDEETDVCVIEAMKVFNNIKAECRGTIVRVLVENGAPVEYGQPLFLVKPTA